MRHKCSPRLASLLVVLVWATGVSGLLAGQLEWRDAKDWIKSLENPDRLARLELDRRLAPLELKPGQIVADIGAGTGVFSRAIAKAVGPTGKVFAEDIQQGLVDFIAKRAKEEGIRNIVPILGAFDDPRLPTKEVELVWIHDVFHAIEHKDRFLLNLVSSLRPDARIAIVDWVKDDPAALKFHGSLSELVSPEELAAYLGAVGFRPIKRLDGFSVAGIRQYYFIFSRTASDGSGGTAPAR